MISFIFKLINEDIEYFDKYKHLCDLKMTRQQLTPEEQKKADWAIMSCLAINYELKELKGMIKDKLKDDFRAFVIYGEFKETNGKKWPNFYTYKKIFVKGEENRGPQEKALNLKFNPILNIDFLKPGYLVVEKCKCTQPKIYEITTSEDGKKHYPYIWIDEIYSFDAFPVLED